MTTVSLSPYRAALTPLTDIIAAVPDWSSPSPCEGWSALDVLDHVLMTQRGLLAERGIPNAATFFETAGVGLSDGKDFGLPGFVRLNFGCPPGRLEAALARIKNALMN